MAYTTHFITELLSSTHYETEDEMWISVVEHGGDGWDDLEEFLDGLTDSVDKLTLCFNYNFEETDRLGKLLKAKLGHVTALRLRQRQNTVASLLKPEYFPNVIELEILSVDIDIIRDISSFQTLKILGIQWPQYATRGLDQLGQQEAIDTLASSLEQMQELRKLRIFGNFLTPNPPEEPGISADPIVAALRVKETLVEVYVTIEGFAADGEKTYSMSEEQQKTLRIGRDINIAARFLLLPRRRYQTEHHKQWAKAVEAAQKEPGKERFEQFHFFFSQLPPDIIETIPQRCANPTVASPGIKYLLGNIEDAEGKEDDEENIGLNGYILILGVLVAIAINERLQKEEEVTKQACRILVLGMLAGLGSIAITGRFKKEACSILTLGILVVGWAITIQYFRNNSQI